MRCHELCFPSQFPLFFRLVLSTDCVSTCPCHTLRRALGLVHSPPWTFFFNASYLIDFSFHCTGLVYSRKLYDNKHRGSCRSVPAEHSGGRLTHSEIYLVDTLPKEKCWNVPLSAVVPSRHIGISAREGTYHPIGKWETNCLVAWFKNNLYEKQTVLLIDLKITRSLIKAAWSAIASRHCDVTTTVEKCTIKCYQRECLVNVQTVKAWQPVTRTLSM